MLITKRFLLCDSCYKGTKSGEYSTASEYRKAAVKYEGWICVKGKDYCPECKPNKHMEPTHESLRKSETVSL